MWNRTPSPLRSRARRALRAPSERPMIVKPAAWMAARRRAWSAGRARRQGRERRRPSQARRHLGRALLRAHRVRRGHLRRSAAVLAPSSMAGPRGPATGFGSGRARGLDLGEAADLAGEGEEVMGGVQRLVCGVELVEHRADECGLADVLGNADALRVGGQSDRGVGLVREADRGRVESHGRDFTRGPRGRASRAKLPTAPDCLR